MRLKLYQIDAFASKVFEGNPAAVIPLETWLDDETMQRIAMENNLSETAFIVPTNKGFHIRWFTPLDEVDMCGHATLATAYVIFHELGYAKDSILFDSKSGELTVTKEGELLSMDFPAQSITEVNEIEKFAQIFGIEPLAVYKSMDYLVVFDNEAIIQTITFDKEALKALDLRGVIVTAPSQQYDFICRFFAPKYGIDEDSVTGSAYTQLISYWSKALHQTSFNSKQISPRGGEVLCQLQGERCIIKGQGVKYLEGEITI